MLNPQFVAGEHGLFGGHKSEDIRTFYLKDAKKTSGKNDLRFQHSPQVERVEL